MQFNKVYVRFSVSFKQQSIEIEKKATPPPQKKKKQNVVISIDTLIQNKCVNLIYTGYFLSQSKLIK